MTDYIINKSFEITNIDSVRTRKVKQLFGLGFEREEEWVVYDQLKLSIEKGDLVYISGESGSGKSVILRELSRQMKANRQVVVDMAQIRYSQATPIIDQIGSNLSQALEILSMAGLNDAFLFVRPPSQLSDGQLFRFKLALLMSSDADVWIVDEFCSLLDRITAQAVAFAFQKCARKNAVTALVATSHGDLGRSLAPNVTISKSFKEVVDVNSTPQ